MARLGIDLSGDSIAMADVRMVWARVQLRGYALLEPIPDRTALTEALRRISEEHGFPGNAEVVAWAGEPRVSAVRAAGYVIERVVLPGEALARVDRLYRGFEAPSTGEVVSLLSLDPSSGSMAVVRDGTVLYEAPLTWSSSAMAGSPAAKGADLLRRYAFLFELTELLHSAFAIVRQSYNARVSKILTCGSLPDLRSVTMPLAQEFDVDVDTLDSAELFDLRRLKGHTREEAETAIAALQLAIVAGRRWHRTPSTMSRALRIAMPVGVAAAAYGIYAAGSLGSFGSSGSSGSPVSPGSRPAADRGEPAGSSKSGLPGAPSAATSHRTPRPPENQPSLGNQGKLRNQRNEENQRNVRNLRNLRNLRNDPAPVSLSLTSILWSPDRQLAIIEGQVLAVGDRVAGMKIVKIEPNRVILLDRAGRLRRVELRTPRPAGSE